MEPIICILIITAICIYLAYISTSNASDIVQFLEAKARYMGSPAWKTKRSPVPFTGELPKNEKIKQSKTIREVCLSLGKDSSKADLLKELKKYGYTDQDFINYFGH